MGKLFLPVKWVLYLEFDLPFRLAFPFWYGRLEMPFLSIFLPIVAYIYGLIVDISFISCLSLASCLFSIIMSKSFPFMWYQLGEVDRGICVCHRHPFDSLLFPSIPL